MTAKQRLKSPRLRLFVALELPAAVREGLVAWQRAAVEAEPALRAVPPEGLHLTLAFLGWHPERYVEAIAAAALDLGGIPAPRVRLLPEPRAVPSRGRPRLFAVEAADVEAGEPGPLRELRSRVEARLSGAGFHEPERREWWPHVTVARVRPERGAGRPRRVGEPPPSLPEILRRPFECVRVALYRSDLRPQGAEYALLAQLDLRPDRQAR